MGGQGWDPPAHSPPRPLMTNEGPLGWVLGSLVHGMGLGR